MKTQTHGTVGKTFVTYDKQNSNVLHMQTAHTNQYGKEGQPNTQLPKEYKLGILK